MTVQAIVHSIGYTYIYQIGKLDFWFLAFTNLRLLGGYLAETYKEPWLYCGAMVSWLSFSRLLLSNKITHACLGDYCIQPSVRIFALPASAKMLRVFPAITYFIVCYRTGRHLSVSTTFYLWRETRLIKLLAILKDTINCIRTISTLVLAYGYSIVLSDMHAFLCSTTKLHFPAIPKYLYHTVRNETSSGSPLTPRIIANHNQERTISSIFPPCWTRSEITLSRWQPGPQAQRAFCRILFLTEILLYPRKREQSPP